MAKGDNFNSQVWRVAMLTLALVACLVFGIVVLANRDWIPGGVIVTATVVGLAREIPVMRTLCSTNR